MGESCRGPASSLEKGRKANKRKSEKQRNQRAIHSYLFHQKSKSEVVVGDSVPFVNQSGAVGFFSDMEIKYFSLLCHDGVQNGGSCSSLVVWGKSEIIQFPLQRSAMKFKRWLMFINAIYDVEAATIRGFPSLMFLCLWFFFWFVFFFFIWFFEPNRTRSTSRRGRWTSAGVKKKKPSRCRRGAMTRRNGRRWLDTPLDFGSHSSCQNGPSQRSFLLLRHLFFPPSYSGRYFLGLSVAVMEPSVLGSSDRIALGEKKNQFNSIGQSSDRVRVTSKCLELVFWDLG